jgi:predicted membrane protein
MKEPLAAGLLAWLAFEVVLLFLGTAGTAQMFTMFIGAPAFIGSTMIGAALGERSAEA